MKKTAKLLDLNVRSLSLAGQPKFIRDDNLEERAFKRYKRSQEKGDYSLVNALDEHGER